jgi:hypothetical protein
MHPRTLLWALGLLVGGGHGALAAAVDEAFTCRSHKLERRVELRHAERASRLPCQVVYWRDGTQPDSGKPVWEAENDYGFCIEQTQALLQRLEDSGWSCEKLRPDQPAVETAEAAEAIPALAPRGLAELLPQAPADRGKLDRALARDLSRLAELSAPGARFEIAAAELGDLDRDGDADAAVLLTYLADQRQPAQFLMTYRFDGDTFQPTAKTYLGSVGAGGSVIERVDDGAIELWLELPEPEEGVRRQRQTFVLQDATLLRQSPEG